MPRARPTKRPVPLRVCNEAEPPFGWMTPPSSNDSGPMRDARSGCRWIESVGKATPIRAVISAAAAANPVPDRVGLTVHASPLRSALRARTRCAAMDTTSEGTGPERSGLLVDDLKRSRSETRFASEPIAESSATGRGGLAIPAIPVVDFTPPSGTVREEPLTRIQKGLGARDCTEAGSTFRMSLNTIDADVTELERFRKQRKA